MSMNRDHTYTFIEPVNLAELFILPTPLTATPINSRSTAPPAPVSSIATSSIQPASASEMRVVRSGTKMRFEGKCFLPRAIREVRKSMSAYSTSEPVEVFGTVGSERQKSTKAVEDEN